MIFNKSEFISKASRCTSVARSIYTCLWVVVLVALMSQITKSSSRTTPYDASIGELTSNIRTQIAATAIMTLRRVL